MNATVQARHICARNVKRGVNDHIAEPQDARRQDAFENAGYTARKATDESRGNGSQFMDCINRHDADQLAEWMTEDHVFIDSLGQAVRGRERMRIGWRGYYALCPDYWVSREEILSDGNVVAVFGSAGGTIAATVRFRPRTDGALRRPGWRSCRMTW